MEYKTNLPKINKAEVIAARLSNGWWQDFEWDELVSEASLILAKTKTKKVKFDIVFRRACRQLTKEKHSRQVGGMTHCSYAKNPRVHREYDGHWCNDAQLHQDSSSSADCLDRKMQAEAIMETAERVLKPYELRRLKLKLAGYTFAEIGRKEGISGNAVSQSYYIAINHLKERFNNDMPAMLQQLA